MTAPAAPASPSTGSSSIMGTTAMSWNSRMPVESLPWAVSSSVRSEYILSTMAVLLSDARNPKKRAWGSGIAESERDAHDHGDGQDHLDAAADQELAARSQDVGDGKFDAHGEQQQDHADLREPLDHPGLGDDRRTVGADEHAGDQEPHERRQFCPVEEVGDRQGDREQDNKLAKYGDFLFLHGMMIA